MSAAIFLRNYTKVMWSLKSIGFYLLKPQTLVSLRRRVRRFETDKMVLEKGYRVPQSIGFFLLEERCTQET